MLLRRYRSNRIIPSMLKVKLARFGKRGQPHYRIVVTEARSKRDGKYTALLGHYSPAQTPKILKIDVDAYKKWLKKGAQPTDTVASLVKKFKSKDPFPAKKKRLSKKAKAKLEGGPKDTKTKEDKTEPKKDESKDSSNDSKKQASVKFEKVPKKNLSDKEAKTKESASDKNTEAKK